MERETFALLIPIISIVLGIGIGFWAIYWDHQKKRLQYDERRLMIEKGMTPPPDLTESSKTVTPEDALRRGIIMTCLGVGLAVGSYILLATRIEAIAPLLGVAAAIVGLIGVGYLIYYAIAGRRPPVTTAGEERPL